MSAFFLLCAVQTLLGLFWDGLVGDPPHWPHPARWVGRLIGALEARLRRRGGDLRRAGLWLCLGVTLAAAAATALPLLGLAALDAARCPYSLWFRAGWASVPWASALGGGLICGVWFSWRALAAEALLVYRRLCEGDLPGARTALSRIVGRDTAALDEPEIARAAVETVGENAVDGGLAPFCFALLGGPVLLSFFKAASTLDSMVGYKNERYRDLGMVSARLDDALNYLPARLALLVFPLGAWLARLAPWQALRIGWRDCRRHPSPNSAFGESLFAGALGVQLGGPATYGGVASEKPRLGDARRPLEAADIPRACLLLFAIAALLAAGLVCALVVVWPG